MINARYAKLLALLLLIYLAPVLASAMPEAQDSHFQKMWNGLSEIANEAADLATSEDRNDKTTLETITFRKPKYQRLLKDAQNILGGSDLEQKFEEIEALRNDNRTLNEKINDLKKKRVAAPLASKNPFKSTRKEMDDQIAECKEQIALNNEAIDLATNEALAAFNQKGLNISREEFNYFLLSAEGDELVRLMTLAANMKSLQETIGELLREDRDNIDLARYYAGMYLVCMDAWREAHTEAIANIAVYRDRLAAIRAGAIANLEDARNLLTQAQGQDKANIESNVGINEKTIEVANLYDSLLQRRIASLENALRHIGGKVAIARNTYKTLANGSALLVMVNDSANEYLLLTTFEMPELQNMYDEGIMSAFADISEKIRNWE